MTSAAKRTQGVRGPRHRVPKGTKSREPLPFANAPAAPECRNREAPRSRRGLMRAGRTHIGDRQEPGRPRRLHLEMPDGHPAEQAQAPRPRARRRGERRDEPERGYRQAKETKRGGTDGEDSELLVVPRKRGKAPSRPRGGKGEPD